MATAVRQGLRGTTGPAGDVLPLAAKAGADLGARVHRAVLELPYIHRDAEDQVRAYLTAGRPVLIVGSSMVGKTRMAAILIQAMFANRRVVIPNSREALASLDSADVVIHDSVIFLDDINRLIGPGGIADGALDRLIAALNIIIATIRAAEYDRFQPTDKLRPPEWDVLSVFERVFISRELSDAELQRLAEAVADPGVRARVQRVGVGEYAGAAEYIAEALRLGPSVSPAGFALVLGAADWRRAGMRAPIPAAVLPDLAAPHLQAHQRADLSTGELYQAALAWATRDINPTVALLQQAEPDMFTVYDFALDLLSKQARPIPDATWPILIQHATPADLTAIGYSAKVTFGQSEIAREAWSRAADSEDPDAAPEGAIGLGDLLEGQGDVRGAKAAYQRAINSGHAKTAPVAAVRLGDLLGEQGDVRGAKAAYQRAINSGHPGMAAAAAIGLGDLLRERGDVAGAKAAYQRAIDSGHADMAAAAAGRLGTLLYQQGDLVGTKAAYQRVLDSGQAELIPSAAVIVGELLQRDGDMAGALTAFERAVDSGHADMAPLAAVSLGNLLKEQGDVAGAKAAYQRAIDSRHADQAPVAAVMLGELLKKRGDVAGAKAAYQEAINSGHPDSGPAAAVILGELLYGQGDVAGAKAAYQQAINSRHADLASVATTRLGELLKEQG
jgi:tetratricopeptide (TPR) repeat protein